MRRSLSGFCSVSLLLLAGGSAQAARVDSLDLERATAREVARIVVPQRSNAVSGGDSRLRRDAEVHTLEPVTVELSAVAVKIAVPGATSLRLRLEGVRPGSILWIAGEEGAFERVEAGDAGWWTPTTQGAVVYLASEDRAGLSLVQLAVANVSIVPLATSCLRDAACLGDEMPPEIAQASRAIAMIRFVRGNASYVCSGALVNDVRRSGEAFFLTAHHCIATAEEAASIEAVWDAPSTACDESGSRKRSVRTWGADLLVTSAATDVTLLRMHALPADRVHLDVELDPVAEGTATYRLSHADGGPLTYATGVVRDAGAGCGAAPRPEFLYSAPTSGGLTMGSSGAPLLLPGLRLAGQLYGTCGPAPGDACASANDAVDGSIAASWPLLAPFLDAPATGRRRASRS